MIKIAPRELPSDARIWCKSVFHQKAFTQIELLMAMAVVLILMAITISVISHVREHASNVACSTQLRSLAGVSLLYASDNNGSIPPVSVDAIVPTPPWYWYDHLFQYIGREHGRDGRIPAGEYQRNPWWCPTVEEDPERFPYSYAVNRICGYKTKPATYVKLGERHYRGSIQEIPNSLSEVAWYADVVYGVYFSGDSREPNNVGNSLERTLEWRHGNKANVAFLDGHVERVENPDFRGNPSLLGTEKWQKFFGTLPN